MNTPRIPLPIILIHGFNVWDGGRKTIGKLRPFFEERGHEVHAFKYGWTGLLGVRFFSNRRGRQLAAMSGRFKESIAIGHSNGCNIIIKAAWRGARFKRVVFINPALDDDTPLPPQIDRADVWHSPSDGPVRVAKFLWFHPWGDMGASGYDGDDPRYRNFNKEMDFAKSSRAHSDVFTDEMIPYFGPLITKAAEEDFRPES